MNALAPMARLMGAGDLMVEYDQQYERYGVPQPQLLALQLAADAARPDRPGVLRLAPAQRLDRLDAERTGPLGARATSAGRHPSSPTRCPTRGPCSGASRTRGPSSWRATPPASTTSPVSGLLNTDSAIYYAGTLADRPGASARPWPSQGAQLVLTDTNRKQAFRWDTLTANAGYTETPGENPAKTDLSDSPIELFPGTTISSKTYASYVGAVNVTASSYGNSVSYTPEDQAYSAIDDNFDTAWITGTFVPDPAGPVVAGPASPARSAPTTSPLVQPQRGDRSRWVSAGHPHLRRQGSRPLRPHRGVPRHHRARRSPSPPARSTPCG